MKFIYVQKSDGWPVMLNTKAIKSFEYNDIDKEFIIIHTLDGDSYHYKDDEKQLMKELEAKSSREL